MKPEQALEEARRRAAAQSDAEAIEGLTIEPTDRVGLEQLIEWAVVEADPDQVRSTRALGAPITAIKRGMVRLTRQQTGLELDGPLTELAVVENGLDGGNDGF